MAWGGKAVMVSAGLAAAGCAVQGGKLEVRAISDPAAKVRAGSGDLAEAKSLLALGSVGLALEAFRKTLRDQPSSAEAMAGVAACYAAMGRYDLAQSNYEAALAVAPHDPRLLTALADSLDRQGKSSEAAKARAEALEDARPPAPPAAPNDGAGRTIAADAAPTTRPISMNALASSVTVELPPARAANTMAAAPLKPEGIASTSSITVALPPARSAAPIRRSAQVAKLQQPAAPRLERLSAGEVALVTSGKPIWQAQLVTRAHTDATVRWVPIQSAAARPNIRVLNAAREVGLAARARNLLAGRGWRRIEIGDSSQVRDRSVVFYPADRRVLARSLAAQFGIHRIAVQNSDVLVVFLGRDRAGLKAAQRRG